ncbi:MAG TPA: hypothetical protein VMU92_00655 [Acidobacteriaceae bacterium]|nr:hypothetical protein [Acidobacteriaceae bacterium]
MVGLSSLSSLYSWGSGEPGQDSVSLRGCAGGRVAELATECEKRLAVHDKLRRAVYDANGGRGLGLRRVNGKREETRHQSDTQKNLHMTSIKTARVQAGCAEFRAISSCMGSG